MITPEQLAEARKDLGRQLAAWRKAAGYTQVSFASPNGPAGYSRSAIANVETGRENMPRSFWEMCDREFGADGALLAAHDQVDTLVRRLRRQRTIHQREKQRQYPPTGADPVLAVGHEAATEQDLGSLFRSLLAQGWSRAELAATTGLAEERVQVICQSRKQVSSYEVLELFATIRSAQARTRPASDGGWLHGKVSELETAHRERHRGADLELLRAAYRTAERLHRGKTRRNGEPFPTHPVSVAHTIAELGLDTCAVAAALLHDLIDDAGHSAAEFTLADLRAEFGGAVADLVAGVTTLDRIYLASAAGEETTQSGLRRMLAAARTDVRALIIKIVYRLHHMRTLRLRQGTSQVHTATAIRDLIIPLADRLGLYAVRRELEDLVLAALEPEIYRQLDDYLRTTADLRRAQVATAHQLLATALQPARISAEVHDQPRHHAAVYRGMATHPQLGPQNPPRFVVVVAGQVLDCYRALGAVHQLWRPVPGSFTDLIASPKYDLYQSLHTTVIGPDDQPIDVRVRTEHMHHVAETGVAAELTGRAGSMADPQRLYWLDRLLTTPHEPAGAPGRPPVPRQPAGHDPFWRAGLVNLPRGSLTHHQITYPAGAWPGADTRPPTLVPPLAAHPVPYSH